MSAWATRLRLLSPTRRRIWTPDPNSPVDSLKRTAANLERVGWVPYLGPAITDNRGWVQDGSDPALVPIPSHLAHPREYGKG